MIALRSVAENVSILGKSNLPAAPVQCGLCEPKKQSHWRKLGGVNRTNRREAVLRIRRRVRRAKGAGWARSVSVGCVAKAASSRRTPNTKRTLESEDGESDGTWAAIR